MSRRPEAPCDHWDDQIGTIAAGDVYGKGPFCSVATCAACLIRSKGYVSMVTGLEAGELLTYEQARAEAADVDR